MWHDKFWFCYSKCCDISGTSGLFWKLSSTNNSTSNSNSKAKERKSIYACLVNTERNNGVITLGTTTSADRVMTKFTFRVYMYMIRLQVRHYCSLGAKSQTYAFCLNLSLFTWWKWKKKCFQPTLTCFQDYYCPNICDHWFCTVLVWIPIYDTWILFQIVLIPVIRDKDGFMITPVTSNLNII